MRVFFISPVYLSNNACSWNEERKGTCIVISHVREALVRSEHGPVKYTQNLPFNRL